MASYLAACVGAGEDTPGCIREGREIRYCVLISSVSLLLRLLSAGAAWPRRIGWWRQLLKRQREKDASCGDFCKAVSFILPILHSDFNVSSSAFFSETSPPPMAALLQKITILQNCAKL